MKKRLTILPLALLFFSQTGALGNTYTTNFPLTENPISEGGRWLTGKKDGLDWQDVRTTSGFAFGTQSGAGGPPYDDSIAELTGVWGPNQTVQATVHTVNQLDGGVYEEVELHLRTTITAHSITGYEVNFRCTHDGTQYVQIARYNGPINNYTMLSDFRSGRGLYDGDVVKATMIGSVITAYLNGAQVSQATDPSPFVSGNPAMGFWFHGGTGVSNSDYGFTSFTATDGSSTNRCDLNGDQAVNVLDLQGLANAILANSPNTATFDINKDGSINALDLQVEANIILGKAPCP